MTAPFPMTRSETALKWVLRINGAITLLALLAVFMPIDWMNQTHEKLGMGPLPRAGIFEYLARTVSALYAIHGGLCFVLASDVRRFGPVITYVAIVEMIFAGLLVWIDIQARMPAGWIATEAPTVVLMSGTILTLRMKAKREKQLAG